MSQILQPVVIDGIKCFSPEVANSYDDYPDGGFDLTEKSSETSFWVRSRNRLFKSIVKRFLAKDRKTKLLEIGCGNGGFIKKIAEDKNIEVTGSEIYVKGLSYARKSLPDVNFIQFDVSQGILGESYDMILAFDVLEHIEKDIDAMSNIKNMLSAGGKLIVSVPQHMFLWSSLDEIVKHKRRYSRSEMLDKLRASGLEISYCTSFVFALFPLMVVSRIFDRRRTNSQSDEAAFEKKVSFSGTLNWIFDKVMQIDEFLIRAGASLPFGGTLVVVAKRND
jgi:2-polyprenyl-3-methyl-5-hydroxy-6-metoxy-1,4-benzoquinol methylase